jgi:hypothetical protein
MPVVVPVQIFEKGAQLLDLLLRKLRGNQLGNYSFQLIEFGKIFHIIEVNFQSIFG